MTLLCIILTCLTGVAFLTMNDSSEGFSNRTGTVLALCTNVRPTIAGKSFQSLSTGTIMPSQM